MPRKMLVVSRLPCMDASEGSGLVRIGVDRRFAAGFSERFVEQLPAFAGDAGGARNRPAETAQLAGNVIEGRLELPAQLPPLVREEHVPGKTAQHCTYCCCRYRTRIVVHARLLFTRTPEADFTSYVPRTWTAEASETPGMV